MTLDKLSSLRQSHLLALAAYRKANDCRAPSVIVIRATELLVLDTGLAYARELHRQLDAEKRRAS